MSDRQAVTPLRLRYPLQHRETAAGFASRLAAVNKREMGTFLRDMAIPPRAIDKGVEQYVRELALIGGADPDALLRYTPHPDSREWFHVVAGEVFGRHAINRTYFRFCPACVKLDMARFLGPELARPWLRLEWTLAHFRSCNHHGIQFVTTTPLRIRFQAFDFAETMAQYLDGLNAMIDSAAIMPSSPFQGWLLRRLDGESDPGFWLDRFPLYVGAEWCEALGVSSLHPSKVKASTLTEINWAEAADEGFRISAGGEDAIRAFLQTRNDAEKRTRGFWGLRDTYGYAYGLLQKTVEDSEFEPIRALVRDFANSTIPIEPGADVLGVIIEQPKVLTVHSAARASGAAPGTMRKLFERKGVNKEAMQSELRNHRVTTSSSEVAIMVEKLKGALTTPQVLKLTGIPRLHLNALLALGALPTVTGSETTAHAKHRFAREDVDAMLAELFKGAVDVAEPGPRQLSIMETRPVATISVEDLLKLIIDKKLKWKGRLAGRSDYHALLVDADEVTTLVRSEPPLVNLRRQDVPTFIPGMNIVAIGFFVEEELLVEDMEFSAEARREVSVVTKDSAELFRKNFVTLGELRQLSSLHLKQIKLLLRGVDIEPEYEPDEAKVWIYDRRAVDQVLRERPNFWNYNKAKALSAVAGA